jgi:hypothetical protein
MIGYVTTAETADSVLAAIASAFDARNLPRFWSPGKYLIYSGKHAGLYFIPAGDGILDAPLMGSPVQTPQDFPEFEILIAMMGGLESRVEIDPSDITSPEEP